MELPNDIASCHRIIQELSTILEGIKPQEEGYIQHFEAQQNQIGRLELREKKSESQKDQSSRNSSRLPSSDMYYKKPVFPRVKGGKVGGKEGPDGGTLKMVDHADKFIHYNAKVCTHCSKVHSQVRLVMRGCQQVFDVPSPGLEVAEHQVLDWVCADCQYENRGEFLAEVCTSNQYSIPLQTMSVLFNNACATLRNEIQLMFKELYGEILNKGILQS